MTPIAVMTSPQDKNTVVTPSGVPPIAVRMPMSAVFSVTIISLGFNFGVLAMMCMLPLHQLRIVRMEAQLAKARRLRYKQGDCECEPSALAEKHWHTFLSHVWSTGQDQVPPQEFEGRFPLLMAADGSRLMASVRLWLADAYHQATSARCAAVGIANSSSEKRDWESVLFDVCDTHAR